MKIFNGKYSWDGKKHDDQEPIAWFPGAYNLKIIDLAESGGGKVRYLKPYLCIFSQTGEGLSISENPEKFAKHICSDFSLDIDKVLWVEDLGKPPERYETVIFTRTGKFGDGYFYHAERRKAIAGEVQLIEKALAGLQLSQ
jgi:hypothetical protein